MSRSLATPPQKRRRLDTSASCVASSKPQTTPFPSTQTSTGIRNVCGSCRRANLGQAALPSCSRCTQPTCSVCSRTCTIRVASVPPTPPLSYTPTPTPSPRHSGLILAPSTNLPLDKPSNPFATQGKRKKLLEPENEDKEFLQAGKALDGFAPGCGRLVCRNCCMELEEGVACRGCDELV
ncbi:hypothetical protein K523DRAFT_371662 [Schizophyllum commune Tattone D]|nr:hypothetical protein K525DRAFT_283853 [Schizophyllum commune Loenen D]KAI5831114.1 hypothetical protein K523DRAFT_371662 [Schizophyllum commune Tattone D]